MDLLDFPGNIFNLIEHPYFQRLRRISQLGLQPVYQALITQDFIMQWRYSFNDKSARYFKIQRTRNF